jgi:hypothetical protein
MKEVIALWLGFALGSIHGRIRCDPYVELYYKSKQNPTGSSNRISSDSISSSIPKVD